LLLGGRHIVFSLTAFGEGYIRQMQAQMQLYCP